MVETLTEFFKSLNKKEKIIVISSMSALAVVLIAVVLLISFCGFSKHQHDYQYTLEEQNGKYNVVGKCIGEEGDCRDREIVLSDVQFTETVTKQPNCMETGEILHTYTIDGVDLTYTSIIEKTDHRLNGSYAYELSNADGSFNYDVPGVKVGATTKYVCEGTVNGYFNCEDCKGVVNINVFKPHIAVEITVTPVTCTTAGVRKNICKDCSINMSEEITVPAAGHRNTYELKNIAGSTATLVSTCSACSVVNSQKVSDLKNNGYVDGKATCAARPQVKYDAKIDATGETISFVVDGDPIPHKLNGKTAVTNYDYGTPGIKYFTDGEIECGETGSAYFICEACEGIAEVTVTKPDHVMGLDYDTLVAPSTTTTGSINYACSNVDCDFYLNIVLPVVITSGEGKNATVISPATETTGEIVRYEYTTNFQVKVEIDNIISSPAIGHNYTYTFDDITATGVGAYVSGKCSNVGCSESSVLEKISYSKKISDLPATCASVAKQVYEVKTESGLSLTLEIETGTELSDSHVLNGVAASTYENSDGTYYFGIPGIKSFSNKELECDEIREDGYYHCDECNGVVSVIIKGQHDYSLAVDVVPTTTSDGSGTLSCSKCKTSFDITIEKLILSGTGKNAIKIKETATEIVYQYTLIMSPDEKITVELKVPKS